MKRLPVKTFQDLIVWQKSHQLVLAVYELSRSFPYGERYGITAQIRRSAVSVAANIAEGFRKKGIHEKARFLNIAQGSLEETRYYFILIEDLKYGDVSRLTESLEEVSRLLTAYHSAILKAASPRHLTPDT